MCSISQTLSHAASHEDCMIELFNFCKEPVGITITRLRPSIRNNHWQCRGVHAVGQSCADANLRLPRITLSYRGFVTVTNSFVFVSLFLYYIRGQGKCTILYMHMPDGCRVLTMASMGVGPLASSGRRRQLQQQREQLFLPCLEPVS